LSRLFFWSIVDDIKEAKNEESTFVKPPPTNMFENPFGKGTGGGWTKRQEKDAQGKPKKTEEKYRFTKLHDKTRAPSST